MFEHAQKHKSLEEKVKGYEKSLQETQQELNDLLKQKEPIILFDEYEKKESNLTKITGQLTSNLRARKSSDIPAMAFFRKERKCQEHTIEECQRTKCQNCEIPVVFRIKSSEPIHRKC
jgi:hypothetical protein